MKTPIQILILLYLLLFGILLPRCTIDKPLSSIEVTNGDCSGRVLNQDGSPAAGVLVRLIPEDFTPMASSPAAIDSAITDDNGIYAFDVTASRYYTIIAQNTTVSCLADSVYLQPDSIAIIDDLILKLSGYLTGVITLKAGSDPANAIILLRGTDRYTSPDSYGSFRTPALPRGVYGVRIFTTDQGYAVFDTFANINIGAETVLNVTLPSTDAPKVEGLTIDLDSAGMYLTLGWTRSDTSRIVTYRITRQHADGTDTSFLIDKSAVSFTDDVTLFENDTLTYLISAIGVNYREGYKSVFPKVAPKNRIVPFRIVELDYPGEEPRGEWKFAIAVNNDIMLISDHMIRRFNTNGMVTAKYEIADESSSNIIGYDEDGFGNWYSIEYNFVLKKWTLYKLNQTLEIQRHRECTFPPYYTSDIHLEVARNGTVYLTTQSDTESVPATLHCSIYDSTLSLTGGFFKERSITIPNDIRIGDTLVAFQYVDSDTMSSYPYISTMYLFDLEYNLLSSFSDYNLFNQFTVPKTFTEVYDGFFTGPGGVLIGSLPHHPANTDRIQSVLVFTDQYGRLLARKLVATFVYLDALQFDTSGNLYLKEWNSITQRWTIYEYSTDWLSAAATSR